MLENYVGKISLLVAGTCGAILFYHWAKEAEEALKKRPLEERIFSRYKIKE